MSSLPTGRMAHTALMAILVMCCLNHVVEIVFFGCHAFPVLWKDQGRVGGAEIYGGTPRSRWSTSV